MSLRRYAQPQPSRVDAGERCDICATAIDARHGHVVDLDQRSMRCACRGCYLLFTAPGSGGRRYRAVPERYLTDPGRRLADADWAALRIPVTTAFLFTNSDLGRVVACYPSPAGATECVLEPGEWEPVRNAYPLLAEPADDVEAIFVSRSEAFLVPIDACYALTGEIRLGWRGLDGGDAVRRTLDRFLADLRARCRPLAGSR